MTVKCEIPTQYQKNMSFQYDESILNFTHGKAFRCYKEIKKSTLTYLFIFPLIMSKECFYRLFLF